MGGKGILLLTTSALESLLGAGEGKGVIWGGDCLYSTEHWGHLSPGQALELSCKTNEEISVMSKTATYQLWMVYPEVETPHHWHGSGTAI